MKKIHIMLKEDTLLCWIYTFHHKHFVGAYYMPETALEAWKV